MLPNTSVLQDPPYLAGPFWLLPGNPRQKSAGIHWKTSKPYANLDRKYIFTETMR